METIDTSILEFVEFWVDKAERFAALCAAFEALKHDKDADAFRADEDWLAVFDDEVLAHFWWPPPEERAARW